MSRVVFSRAGGFKHRPARRFTRWSRLHRFFPKRRGRPMGSERIVIVADFAPQQLSVLNMPLPSKAFLASKGYL